MSFNKNKYHAAPLLLFLLLAILAKGQEGNSLLIKYQEASGKAYEESFRIHRDSLSMIHTLKEKISELHGLGYLAATLDSITVDNKVTTAYILKGAQYHWVKLSTSGIDEIYLNQLHFRSKLVEKKPFNIKQFNRLENKLISLCENDGYPFASVDLDSVGIEEDRISACLVLKKGHKVMIDSVVIKGKVRINGRYLQSYLGVKQGKSYKESNVSQVSKRIAELPFLRETKPFRVVFTKKYSNLIVYLENKSANQLDGLIGFLPDDTKPGKLLVTGQAHVLLMNSFAAAETIELDWRKLQVQTQDLKGRFVLPYLLGSPFGSDVSFKIYRRDSSFREVMGNAGIQYLFIGGNYFKTFVTQRKLILGSTTGMESINTLPEFADISTLSYGIGLSSNHTDYRFNPRKGYFVYGNASAGNKKITQHPDINPLVYQNLDLSSIQYNIDLNFDFYIPVRQRSVLASRTKTAAIIGKNTFVNELFRIGGIATLRGFDEESIYASSFAISALEYRYLLDKNSYLFMFTNAAYYENMAVSFTGKRSDIPYGFGAGISFETKAGIVNVTYALGSQQGNPIVLRAAKIHFGLTGTF